MRALGIAVGVLGAVLALRSTLLLAGRGRPRRGPQPPFVLAGPYLRIRNPQLAGLGLVLLGAAATLSSWWLTGGVVVAAVAAHGWVVRVEEPKFRAQFGAAYTEYLRRVPRWLPSLGRRSRSAV